jgi:predicted transposase YbfD/YdcC
MREKTTRVNCIALLIYPPGMCKKKRRDLSTDEQHILEHCHLQLLTSPDDTARCDQAIIDHHYLHHVTLVGEHLRYALIYRGKWLAVATWSSAAFHLKARDHFIGWSPEQCRRRLGLLANNSRLLVMPDCHSPNLISRFMKLMLQQLSQDWEKRWEHPLALVETFVDPRFYQGTAYKVSGWSHLGRTAGWKRDADDFYEKNDAPKQIWVRELVKKACVKLRAQALAPAWAKVEATVPPRCTSKVGQIGSLMEAVRTEIPEFRRAESLAYPIPGMICLMVMASAQGVTRGPHDLANYADTLSQAQLRALGFRRDVDSGDLRCPKKTTFGRVLHAVDDDAIERVLLRWQDRILGPTQDRIVIIDGKKVRHGGVEIVHAVNSAGRFRGRVITESKSNEIPAGRHLLLKQDLIGKLVLADALHTQDETARQILYEQGGDYLFTVKGNQLTVQKTLESLFAKQAFSPSTHAADASDEARAQSSAVGDPLTGVYGSHPQSGGVSGSPTRGPLGDPGQAPGSMVPRGGLSAEQSDPRRVASAGHAFAQARLLGH